MLHKVEPPRPKAVYWYIDSLQLWLTKPLSSGQFRSLRSKCGSVHVWNGPAPWPSSYVQRLQLGQPSLEALQFLSGIIRDAHLNAVEIALDWVFEDEEALDDAFEFACRHHVKHHHRDQGVRFYPGKKGRTRYSGPRNAPNVLAIYADRPCRITGEFHCLHFDWRIKGSAALRRAGISSVRDLLGFNHGRFWVKR